jgi:hypothetical protein
MHKNNERSRIGTPIVNWSPYAMFLELGIVYLSVHGRFNACVCVCVYVFKFNTGKKLA